MKRHIFTCLFNLIYFSLLSQELSQIKNTTELRNHIDNLNIIDKYDAIFLGEKHYEDVNELVLETFLDTSIYKDQDSSIYLVLEYDPATCYMLNEFIHNDSVLNWHRKVSVYFKREIHLLKNKINKNIRNRIKIFGIGEIKKSYCNEFKFVVKRILGIYNTRDGILYNHFPNAIKKMFFLIMSNKKIKWGKINKIINDSKNELANLSKPNYVSSYDWTVLLNTLFSVSDFKKSPIFIINSPEFLDREKILLANFRAITQILKQNEKIICKVGRIHVSLCLNTNWLFKKNWTSLIPLSKNNNLKIASIPILYENDDINSEKLNSFYQGIDLGFSRDEHFLFNQSYFIKNENTDTACENYTHLIYIGTKFNE